MDGGVATIIAAVVGGIIALGGIGLGVRLNARHDTTAYRRRLQDESRERLRLIYLDVLDVIQTTNQQSRALIVLAYGNLNRGQRKEIWQGTIALKAQMAHIQRQQLLARFEPSIFDTPALIQTWSEHAYALVEVINGVRATRFKLGNTIGRFIPAPPTKPDADEKMRMMDEDFLAIRTAVRTQLTELSTPNPLVIDVRPVPMLPEPSKQ